MLCRFSLSEVVDVEQLWELCVWVFVTQGGTFFIPFIVNYNHIYRALINLWDMMLSSCFQWSNSKNIHVVEDVRLMFSVIKQQMHLYSDQGLD